MSTFRIGTLTWPARPQPPVPSPLAWYDASQIVGVSDGAALATWPDLSGNGYDLTQPATGQRPTYYSSTSAKLVNSRPAVWFSSANNTGMQNYGGFATPPQIFTVAFVAHTTNATLAQNFTDGFGASSGAGTNANDLGFGIFQSGFTWLWFMSLDSSFTPSASSTPDSSLHAFVSMWTGSPGAAKMYIDNTPQSGVTGSNTKTLDHFELGNSWGYTNPLDGPICEAIVWAFDIGALTQPPGQVAAVHTYFQNKWGTP